jgi:hypothetical protein
LGKSRRKKETRKTKVKIVGLCGGYLKTLGVRRWRKKGKDREEWAIILKEAMVKLPMLNGSTVTTA